MANYDHDGSLELRLEKLDHLANTPFNPRIQGGLTGYLDQYDAYMAELEVLEPTSYSDKQKHRIILRNLQGNE